MSLALDNVEVRAGSFALGPLSLAVEQGEYLTVVGPTGAGKTLMLEAIAGLREVERGRVLMNQTDVTRKSPEARNVGFLYQDGLLFPHLNVRENLGYGAQRRGARQPAVELARLARMLQVEALMDRMPEGLSGGERQRVALGRALAASPTLLLLDEPMASLDPRSRHMLEGTLRELHRELGTTTLHVTHNFGEALGLGDRVAVLIGGRLLQVDTPRQVFSHPVSETVGRFVRYGTPPDSLRAGAAAEPAPRRIALELPRKSLEAGLADLSDDAVLRVEARRVQTADTAETGGRAGAPRLSGRLVAVERGNESVDLAVALVLELRLVLAGTESAAQSPALGTEIELRLVDGEDR